MAFVTFAWLIKIAYWRSIDRDKTVSTAATATGLTEDGSVTQMEGPHTAENFVMREMGYEIARRHAIKLRRIALWPGAIIPVLMIVLASMISGWFYTLVITIAVVLGLAGLVVERWLFFAEAKHAVTLYYGQPQV
jgi:DMSO reductase anchor subunit